MHPLPRLLRSLRRFIAAAMILAYVLVAGGIPLPTRKVESHRGEPYPCSARGCGCSSAEHCWTSCCCHTLAEKLAWARENRVRPPDFALAEARSAGLDTSDWDGTRKLVLATVAAKPCCSKQPLAAPTCCNKTKTAQRSCCCSRERSPNGNDPAQHFLGWQALACQGQSLHWLAAVPTLIAVDVDLADPLPRVAWLGPLSSETAMGEQDVPTPPPPECA